jgi:ATP-binding cassette, subfamily C, bacterial LapB
LVMGLYQPTSGSVLVDGVDVRQIDPADLRRNVASVGQDALLFYGTLRDNIALAQPHVDDAEVLAAARAAGLGPFIDRHPQGLHLQVGERGELLSGGQRQAIALARALLHGGAIVCLDEPTSAMDHASEAFVAQRLREHLVRRTLLLSTHRRTMLPLADRLIVVDEGRIVADGPRDKILAALEAPGSKSPPITGARSTAVVTADVKPVKSGA